MLVKIGAVVSSLALAGTYVSCRRIGTHPDAQTDHTIPAAPTPAAKPPDPVLFYGTKSGPVELVHTPPPAPTPPLPTSQTLLPDSKVQVPLIKPSTPAHSPAQAPR
jgi:hypothetical protein